MDAQMDGLPFKAQAHDAMRTGLASLKEDALAIHPVEAIQRDHKAQANARQLDMLKQMYGTAVAAKYEIETQILDRFQRLPGLPSSKLGLEALTGELDEFSFESYLGLPQTCDTLPADLHSQMETRLAMGTKPVTRGFF